MDYVAPKRLGALVLLPPALIALGSLVSYALDQPSHRLQTCATSTLAAVVQHASIRAALPPRSVVTTADDFAFCVYAVVAAALLATLAAMLRPETTKDGACVGLASVLFFLHAKRPAGAGVSWAKTLAAVAVAAAALAAARRLFAAAATAACGENDDRPGRGRYAALPSPDAGDRAADHNPLRQTFLSGDDRDFGPDAAANKAGRRDFEMVSASRRDPAAADGDADPAGDDPEDPADIFL